MIMVETRRSARRSTRKKVGDGSSDGRVKPASGSKPGKRKMVHEPAAESDYTAMGTAKKRSQRNHPSYSYESADETVQETPLLSLPSELFHAITSLLHPDSLTCLSLTCKLLLRIVGRESWALCRSRRQRWEQTTRSWGRFRGALIPLLARDAPHLSYCENCVALHPPLRPPRAYRETAVTRRCFGPGALVDYLPRDGTGGGYNLLFEHVVEARESLSLDGDGDGDGAPIEVLGGNFTVRRTRLDYTLISSGRRVKNNLVLRHEHIFHVEDVRSPLRLVDLVNLPVRICPHQTTSTRKAGPSHYTKSRLPSGLLWHSITTAVPSSLLAGTFTSTFTSKHFATPLPSEKKQMDSADRDPGVVPLWTCRSCPTKWKVEHFAEGGGRLRITAWHSLGDTAYRAQEYWKMLVRREMANLGEEKRNSEFYATGRQFLDFEVEVSD